MRKRRNIIIVIILTIIIALFFLVRGCNRSKSITKTIEEIVVGKDKDYDILFIMKQDEEKLHNLYNSPDICDENWTIKYREIGKTFQNYNYDGKDEEVIRLLENYKEYGKQIEEISIIINDKNYDNAIKELEKLKESASEKEKELNILYEKKYK